MSRWELYRAAKGAFAYLRRCLALLLLSVPLIIVVKSAFLRVLPIFFVVGAVVGLWSKRKVIQDLLEGRTKKASGHVIRQEWGDGLRFLRVYYLFLDTETVPQRLVFFSPPPSAGIPGLLDSPLLLHYLPRSGVIVQVEVLEKPDTPRYRSKGWYQERLQREAELRETFSLKLCRPWERYWFWEDLLVSAPFILFIVYCMVSMLCNIADL